LFLSKLVYFKITKRKKNTKNPIKEIQILLYQDWWLFWSNSRKSKMHWLFFINDYFLYEWIFLNTQINGTTRCYWKWREL